jgi:hypothetical protein
MYKTPAQIDGAILRGSWLLALRQDAAEAIALIAGSRLWLGASFLVSIALITAAKTNTGDLLGGYTDHLHHARATWTFLSLGLEVYTRPLGETGLEVPFPQPGLYWPQFPVAYPPGMFVVFLPVALLGRYVPLSTPVYGKLAVIYLVLLTHAALWIIDSLLRRPGKAYGFLPILMIWLFTLRVALTGFYDGAWLLAGAIATVQLTRERASAAVVWFIVAALISYRAAALVPLALVALWRFHQEAKSWKRKLPVLVFAGVGCAIVMLAFWALSTFSPQAAELRHNADSPLLAFKPRTYLVIGIGVIFSMLLANAAGLLTAASTVLTTLLSILHGGHWWHGVVCVPVLLTLAVHPARTSRAVPIALLFVALMWQFAFDYQPFRFLDELLLFVTRGGSIR